MIQKKESEVLQKQQMGGNAFEDTQKLTPQEYTEITAQIIQLISPLCLKIEPYIPLPQKEVHGDLDFLLILKEGYSIQSIVERMKLQKGQYILNNNLTANTVYRKKQIDFNVAANDQEFQRCKFYKSYGGIGAFLGLLLPSKFVKFNEDGIFCCQYSQHIKLQFNACCNIDQIMIFYGLKPQTYHKGFQNRKQLFEFLLNARFLDPQQMASREIKSTTKLISGFQMYLRQSSEQLDKKIEKVEDCVLATLKYFSKEEEFENSWKQKLNKETVKKQRASKWNGLHIINIFGVPSKEVNQLKKKFLSSFQSIKHYEQFIDENQFQAIAKEFARVCQLQKGIINQNLETVSKQ